MYINKSKKIVIKIGSSIIIDEKGKVRKKWLREFIKDVMLLIKLNKKVIIVSSGAIALGCSLLNLSKNSLKLDKKSGNCFYWTNRINEFI